MILEWVRSGLLTALGIFPNAISFRGVSEHRHPRVRWTCTSLMEASRAPDQSILIINPSPGKKTRSHKSQ